MNVLMISLCVQLRFGGLKCMRVTSNRGIFSRARHQRRLGEYESFVQPSVVSPLRPNKRLISTEIKDSKSEWPLQSIRLNTCATLYINWRQMKVAKNKPLRGVDLDVVYLDTWPTAPRDAPVILALHGIGSSHEFVVPLIPHIIKDRVRIVAPNFPGSGFTKMDPDDHFSHTDQEKAQFTADFLEAVGISKVDVLISHSAAVYPVTYLIDGTNIVKSLVLLMPGGMEPLAKFWRNMHLYLFFSEFLKKIGLKHLLSKTIGLLRLMQPGLRMNVEQVDSAVKSLIYANHQHAGDVLERLSFSSYPILMMYSSDDPHCGPHYPSVIDKLNIAANAFTYYNMKDSVLLPQPQRRSYAIVFETGKHSIETVHHQIIGKAISDLFLYVSNPNK